MVYCMIGFGGTFKDEKTIWHLFKKNFMKRIEMKEH